MFAFLNQYAPQAINESYGIVGGKCGKVCFGGQEFYTISLPKDLFMKFSIRGFEQSKDGLKFHIPVAEQQMAAALPVIAETVGRYKIGCFKVRQDEWGESRSFSRGKPIQDKQEGKDFVIYVGKDKDNPALLQAFLNDLEKGLAEARISKPKMAQIGVNLKKSDKKVLGSNYVYYRYDHPDGSKYLPAVCGFVTPDKGDIMEQICVDSPLNNNEMSKQVRPFWRQTQWRALPDEKNEYRFCCDTYGMTPVQKHKLVQELSKLDIKFEWNEALHRDGRKSDIISILPESQDFFARLHGLEGIENANHVALKEVKIGHMWRHRDDQRS